jgi:hypothetical protein
MIVIVVVVVGSVMLVKVVKREIATTAHATIYRETLAVVPTYL